MVELPGQMQVTLVAFYGDKPPELAQLITYLQDTLASSLGAAFRPYQLEQVHGTLVGLEGNRTGSTIQNVNSGLPVDASRLLSFLRSDFPSITVRVGGYPRHQEFPFTSRGMHPYLRSFSVQDEIALAMGWPVDSGAVNSLDHLRWRFASELNVRHKWHKQEGDCDNDFFFVIGRVDRRLLNTTRLQGVAEHVRVSLAGLDGVLATIGPATLRLVAYLDPQLPTETSLWLAVDDPTLTAARLLALYPSILGVSSAIRPTGKSSNPARTEPR
jgi:hypothetical protein